MSLLVNNIHEKTSRKVKKRMRALYVIGTRVATLHLCKTLLSCYMRMHSFSANKKCVIFSCTILNLLTIFFIQIFVLSDPKKLSLELGVPPVFVREKRSEIERFVVLFSSFLINADLLGDLFL